MYALKPVVALPERIALPTVMYELPKIQGGGDDCAGPDPVDDFASDVGRQVSLPEINLLEGRQVTILKEIYQLKSYLEQLTMAIRLSGDCHIKVEPLSMPARKAVQSCAFLNASAAINQKPVHAEIIVNANPASPPYFILALQQLWTDTKFNVKFHSNSCCGDVTKNSSFEEKLQAIDKSDAVHSIDVTFIWKNVKDIQLVTKVYDFPFEGEANIVRYLTRLVEKYNYEKLQPEVSNSIDTLLDMCLRLPYEEPRYKNATIAKFVSYLDKNSWLLNSTYPSIVDVTVWSVLKRETSNGKIPRELKTWFDLCEKTFIPA